MNTTFTDDQGMLQPLFGQCIEGIATRMRPIETATCNNMFDPARGHTRDDQNRNRDQNIATQWDHISTVPTYIVSTIHCTHCVLTVRTIHAIYHAVGSFFVSTRLVHTDMSAVPVSTQ